MNFRNFSQKLWITIYVEIIFFSIFNDDVIYTEDSYLWSNEEIKTKVEYLSFTMWDFGTCRL